MPDRVLLIDDDQRLADMLVEWMGPRGVQIHPRLDAARGLAALRAPVGGPWDLLLLDLMLPDLDGMEVCRRVRRTDPHLPILMLTARGDPMDRVLGLEVGADDYLPKPFDPRELLARIHALLRRARLDGGPAAPESLRFGSLELDRGALQARVLGEPADLTAHQFELLWALARGAGRVLSRDDLSRAVKGEAAEAFDRAIDVHISRIRAAIEPDPRHPTFIKTVRGAGYLFVAPGS